jgi:hypothetical protein
MKTNATLIAGCILLVACIGSLTLLVALGKVDPTYLTHLVVLVGGGVLGAYSPPAGLSQGTPSVPPAPVVPK